MRPNYSYLNRTSKRKRETDTTPESDEEESGPSIAEQVTVKFKKPTNNLQSADNSKFKKRCDPENWQPCDFYPEHSTVSAVSFVFSYFC